MNGGEVAGGLDESGDIEVHGIDAVEHALHSHQEAARRVGVDGRRDGAGGLHQEAGRLLDSSELGLALGSHDVEQGAHGLLVLHRHGTDGLCFAGNGVVLVAALDVAQPEVELLGSLAEEAAEHLVGVGTAFVDVVATVSAHQAIDRDAEEEVAVGHGSGCVAEADVGAAAAGTADEHLALVLGVEVDEDVTLHESRLHGLGAGQARLLIDGEDTLQGTVLNVGVGDDS